MLETLFTVVVTCLAIAFGWYARQWTLRHRSADARRGEKRCDVCLVELPKTAIRTSTGQWRCTDHKAA